ncbi:MAG: hypothetical protein AAF265_05660 [Pseudomonadota bacterium]
MKLAYSKILAASILMALATISASHADTLTNTRVASYSYVPIEPIPVPPSLRNAKNECMTWDPNDNSSALRLLENEALIASVGQRNDSGTVNYFVADANAVITRGIYTLDSVRYTAIPFLVSDALTAASESQAKVVFLLVGVGARAEIEFSSDRKSVDTSSLLKLGVQAESNKITGQINLRSLGVTSNSVSTLLALPSGLDFANIEATLRSLDAVKLIATVASAAPETSIRVNPQIIAIDPVDIPIQDILKDIYKAAINPAEYRQRSRFTSDSDEGVDDKCIPRSSDG